MQVFSVALPLAALVSGALAAPSWDSSAPAGDACLAAVTGKAALGDSGLRGYHCKSFLATTVTPAPITETVTVTGAGSDKNGWKRATVAVCPNEVPNYASACDEAHYTSACSVFGFTDIITTTVAPTTTTKTVYVKPTGGVVVSGTTCPAASTVTKTVSGSGYGGGKETVTVTVGSGTASSSWGGKETVTVTVGSGSVTATTVTKTLTVSGSVTATVSTVTVSGTCTSSAPSKSTTSSAPSKCVVSDAKATELVNNFATLLEFTNYQPTNGSQIPAGHGYKQDVSDATLNKDFVDISDSINFMAGIPLGSVTFPNKQAFDGGQGSQPEVQVQTLNIWHDCETITWRWVITSTKFPVVGINRMSVGSDGLLIRNYAEFDSGAWLQSYGAQCAQVPPSFSGSFTTKRSTSLKPRNL